MPVQTLYANQVGRGYKISPHITLGEFQCKDGSSKVLYSTELMDKLEQLRAYVGGTISINSGYRTPAYNKSIGGASSSMHTKGYAADICVKKGGTRISGKLICCLCQTLGFKGIALIKGSGYFVHVDMRPSGTYRGDERYGYGNNVGGDFYKYFGINKSAIEALKVKEEPKKEDDIVTQQQFNEMMDTYLATRARQATDAEWSKEAREWAEKSIEGQALITGTDVGKEYLSFLTREQFITILYRFAKRTDPIK